MLSVSFLQDTRYTAVYQAHLESPADLTFSGKFNMLKTGETDHPFVVETDEAAKWGLMV